MKKDGISGICKDKPSEDAFRKAVSDLGPKAKRGVYFDDYVRRALEPLPKKET